jgi:hypothetical protein
MKRTTLFLPQAYVEKVAAFTKASGLAFSDVVRRALDAYLEREAPKLLETAATLKKRRAAR